VVGAAGLDLLLVVGTALAYDLGRSLKLWAGGRFLGETLGLTSIHFRFSSTSGCRLLY